MPGRTYREDYLGDTIVIILRRERDAESGLLDWRMTVRVDTRDGTSHELVREYSRDDVLALLTAPQRTGAVTFGNTVRDRLATALDVLTERP